MEKFRLMTRGEVVRAITRQIPEINPQYVETCLKRRRKQNFTVQDIPALVKRFEIELYEVQQ